MATKKTTGNVSKATLVGVTVGGAATPAIVYAATIIEAKTGVPAAVTMPILGAMAGFFMRWAAKLNPND